MTRTQSSKRVGRTASLFALLATLHGCSKAADGERIDAGEPKPSADRDVGVDRDAAPRPADTNATDAGDASVASPNAGHGVTVNTDASSADASKPDASNPDAGVSSLDSLRSAPYPAVTFPEENPYSEAKALLGKLLFWEEQLSADDTVACGTCHRGAAGGSDPRSASTEAALPGPDGLFATLDDIHGSPGIIACDPSGTRTGSTVQVTSRKAPSYLDAMFARRLFWDGRAECRHEACPNIDAFEDPDNPGTFPIAIFGALENQAVGPPLSAIEMACEGTRWPDLHAKLENATPLALASDIPNELASFIADNGASYPLLFQAAFGSEQTAGAETEINTRRIAFAIATHERRLTSDQTPWDAFNAGDDDALSGAELRGLRVFRERAQCSSCHLPPLFSDGAFHFTGFHRPSSDPGRGAVSGRPTDTAEMRTPTLRNVALRVDGGLLHNGAGLGASLESVVETYVQGGLRDDSEVSAVPITESIQPLELSEQEIADLIAFLRNGLTDPRVAEELPPFDRPRLGSESLR